MVFNATFNNISVISWRLNRFGNSINMQYITVKHLFVESFVKVHLRLIT